MPYLFVKKNKESSIAANTAKKSNIRKAKYFPGKAKSFAVSTGRLPSF
jgi:hypothetical protein